MVIQVFYNDKGKTFQNIMEDYFIQFYSNKGFDTFEKYF